MKDLNQIKFSFTAKKTKTSLIHLCRCLLHILVNESDFYHAANRTTKQKKQPFTSTPSGHSLAAPHLEVSFATWKSESFKGSSQTTHLSWGSVSIICMYIDPLKKLRVSKAQKMCSANSFVDQGRFAGHILEWHILPKHVFFEFLDDP